MDIKEWEKRLKQLKDLKALKIQDLEDMDIMIEAYERKVESEKVKQDN